MHITPLMIDRVLKKNSITGYLKTRGHHPVKSIAGGKLFYNCPLPGHDESKPSFVVFTESAYENFYCFGCQRAYNIIHLISQMESISYRVVMARLSEGVDISPRADNEFILDKMAEDFERPSPFDRDDVLLEMSDMCRLYLEAVGEDSDERCIIEGVWKQIDNDLAEYRFSDVEETFLNLPKILAQRHEKWKSMRFEKMRQAYAGESGNQTSV